MLYFDLKCVVVAFEVLSSDTALFHDVRSAKVATELEYGSIRVNHYMLCAHHFACLLQK